MNITNFSAIYYLSLIFEIKQCNEQDLTYFRDCVRETFYDVAFALNYSTNSQRI